MKKILNVILVVMLVVLIIFSDVNKLYGYEAYDFGIRSIRDMPKVEGCRDDFDEELYYSGIAAGVDPAFLKVIMRKESGGRADISDNINRHEDGSTTRDIGIMQINNKSADSLGIKNYNELRENHLMNIWASTEVIKWKHGFVKENKGLKIAGEVTKEDSLSIFWGYNGRSSRGLMYAKEANKIYEKATKLNKVRRGSIAHNSLPRLMRRALATNIDDIMVVHADDVVREGPMTYDEFIERVEDISNGKIKPKNADIDNSQRKSLREIIRDETRDVGIADEVMPEDVLLNYTTYKYVKVIVKYIYMVVVFLNYIVAILLGLVWTGYVLNNVGFVFLGNVVLYLSNGNLDLNGDGIFAKLMVISIIVIGITATSITGIFPAVLEGIVIRIVEFFN